MRNSLECIAERFGKRDSQVLRWESLLFSGVFGAAYQSWMVFGAILLALCGLLCFHNGKIYASAVLSCLWGIIAASIGHSFGGLPWATLCGLGMASLGMCVHMRSLNLSVDRESSFYPRVRMQMTNHRWGQQNLN